jgi:hypothetical protein
MMLVHGITVIRTSRYGEKEAARFASQILVINDLSVLSYDQFS